MCCAHFFLFKYSLTIQFLTPLCSLQLHIIDLSFLFFVVIFAAVKNKCNMCFKTPICCMSCWLNITWEYAFQLHYKSKPSNNSNRGFKNATKIQMPLIFFAFFVYFVCFISTLLYFWSLLTCKWVLCQKASFLELKSHI